MSLEPFCLLQVLHRGRRFLMSSWPPRYLGMVCSIVTFWIGSFLPQQAQRPFVFSRMTFLRTDFLCLMPFMCRILLYDMCKEPNKKQLSKNYSFKVTTLIRAYFLCKLELHQDLIVLLRSMVLSHHRAVLGLGP